MEFLLDDAFIDRQAGVRRVLAAPRKEPAPVFTFEMPWERPGAFARHTMLYDEEEGAFKLWYRSRVPADETRPVDPHEGFTKKGMGPRRTRLCYATSEDGLTWRRPSMGLVRYQGTTDNNILLEATTSGDSVFYSVIKDPGDADATRRYKAIGFDCAGSSAIGDALIGQRGVCVSYSPDGLRWRYEPRMVMSGQDVMDADCVLGQREPTTGKWVGFFRPRATQPRRFIGYAESDDFESWSLPRMLLTPDSRDDPWTEFYGLSVACVGRWRRGAYGSSATTPSTRR